MSLHKIAVIGGDGIGPEVTREACMMLSALQDSLPELKLDFTEFDWGSDYFLKTGRMMPEEGLEQLKSFDAILFAELDWVIVRENTEGEYSGAGGRIHPKLPQEVGIDVSVFTRDGIERVMRYAFELALTRPKKQLTLVTKSNAQRHGMVLWDEVFEKLKHDYPVITTDRMLVDAITTRMVLQPQSLDTIVATNLHADILSDLAAALSGSLGIGPTANINPERTFPSMFEPIHGSAFDLVGKDLANPLGAFWSCVMMLEHLQEKKAASLLMSAIEEVCRERRHLPIDLGGNSSTGEVTTAVCTALKK